MHGFKGPLPKPIGASTSSAQTEFRADLWKCRGGFFSNLLTPVRANVWSIHAVWDGSGLQRVRGLQHILIREAPL